MGLFDRFLRKNDSGMISISSPVSGRTAEIPATRDRTSVPDMPGVGLAIYPAEGRIYSPVDGRIDLMFATGNAFSLVSNDGIEIFIHIGIDTHKLDGEGFKCHRQTDDAVKKGDLILEFDRLLLEDRGYDETVFMVIMNSDELSATRALSGRVVTTQDNVFEIRR